MNPETIRGKFSGLRYTRAPSSWSDGSRQSDWGYSLALSSRRLVLPETGCGEVTHRQEIHSQRAGGLEESPNPECPGESLNRGLDEMTPQSPVPALHFMVPSDVSLVSYYQARTLYHLSPSPYFVSSILTETGLVISHLFGLSDRECCGRR